MVPADADVGGARLRWRDHAHLRLVPLRVRIAKIDWNPLPDGPALGIEEEDPA